MPVNFLNLCECSDVYYDAYSYIAFCHIKSILRNNKKIIKAAIKRKYMILLVLKYVYCFTIQIILYKCNTRFQVIKLKKEEVVLCICL